MLTQHTTTAGTYQGRSAYHWAMRYKHMRHLAYTRLRTIHKIIRQPVYGTNWLERAFLCIHSHEGSWTANTGNGFFGGLQMDSSFQSSYGGEFVRAFGTANNWPISVQLAVGIRAYLSGRGFGPWPNTRRMCGI